MSVFPLLNLPHPAIQNVFDYWDPFIVCAFSYQSKKCKQIAKAFSVPPTEVEFFYGSKFSVELQYPSTEEDDGYLKCYNFYVNEDGNLHPEYRPKTVASATKKFWIDSYRPKIAIRRLTKQIQEVFKCSVDKITIDSTNNFNVTFDSLFVWINSLSQERIKYLSLNAKHDYHLKSLFVNFPQSKIIETLCIDKAYMASRIFVWPFKCDNFELRFSHFLSYDDFLGVDFKSVALHDCQFTNYEMNEYLIGLEEGTVHPRMTYLYCRMSTDVYLKELLSEINVVFHEGSSMDSLDGYCDIKCDDGKTVTVRFKIGSWRINSLIIYKPKSPNNKYL